MGRAGKPGNDGRVSVKSAIELVVRDWAKAFSDRDLNALARLYTDDAMFFSALGGLRRGREAILEYLDQHWTTAAIAFSDLSVELLSSDVALAALSGAATFEGAEVRGFRFLQTYVWTPKGWRIAGHHGSYESGALATANGP